MVFVEPTFPRGAVYRNGPKRAPTKFGASVEENVKSRNLRPKQRRRAVFQERKEQEQQFELALKAHNLDNGTIQEGMLVLGCVQRILKTELCISLPGRLSGIVPITAISDAYTDRLQKLMEGTLCDLPGLEGLYSVGDLVYVKVMKKEPTLELSLNPTDLHSEFVAGSLVPGLVLAATVAVKEDHVYMMTTGIRNVRAFLPSNELNGNNVDIGRNLFCWVRKVAHTNRGASILTLTAFRPKEKRELMAENAQIDQLVPGCVIPFTVGPPVEGGMRGTLFDDTVSAFVNQNMLTTVTTKPSNYSLFKLLNATLLYVVPVARQVFVSLVSYKGNHVDQSKPAYGAGASIPHAHVVEVGDDGVWFRFGEERAIMPRSVIMQGLRSDCNYEDTVRLGKFQVGSMHALCVVRYDPFDRSYIVCDKLDNATDEICHSGDVHYGQMYRCEIKGADGQGNVSVQLGRLSGIVPKYYLDRRAVIKVGSVVPMRAVRRNKDMVEFTNRAELVRPGANILSEWKQLKASPDQLKPFDGVVVEEESEAFVVAFFNNIRGKVSKYTRGMSQEDDNKVSMLQCGTVAQFLIAEYDKARHKLTLALPQTEIFRWKGEMKATVRTIRPAGVDIELNGDADRCTIPLEWFSSFTEHNTLHVALLKVGQTVTVVQPQPDKCSARDVRYFQYKPFSVKDVRKGDILRASCYNDTDGTLYTNLLLTDYAKPVPVALSHVVSDQPVAIPDGTIIMMAVKSIGKDANNELELTVSSALSDVCPLGIENVYSYMMDYLEEVIGLVGRYKQMSGMSFAWYNIGQEVICTIESQTANDGEEMLVKVHDKANPKTIPASSGVALRPTCTRDSSVAYKAGQRVPGRVVWVDVKRQLLHVCVDPSLLETIGEEEWNFSETRTFHHSQAVYCSVLFANDYVRVCCFRQPGCKHPLMLVPVRHHYNELRPVSDADATEQDDGFPAFVVKKLGPLLFGLHVKSFVRYNSYARGQAAVKLELQDTEACKDEDLDQDDQLADGRKPASTNDQSPGGPEAKKTAKVGEKINRKKNRKSKTKNPTKELPASTTPSPEQAEPVSVALTKKSATVHKRKQQDIPSKRTDATFGVANGNSFKKPKLMKAAVAGRRKQKPPLPFIIDQLDGCDDDFLLEQLDGADSQPQRKGTKRPHLKNASKKSLPGATNFWDSTPVYKRPAADSDSSDDEDSEEEERQKNLAAAGASKKRLTGKERFEAMKQEEDRLRKIEQELADPSTDPHTPDQFDRLVLAQPNNSLLWIRYMVFHMESAALDKARVVARRALKAINFREEAERLNVWVALLNLEIRYETVESFKEVLQEAVQYNDAFTLYSRVLDILIDCQKHVEVRDLLGLLQNKFRKQNDMWYLVADAWYRIGQKSKAKPLLSQALKSLPNRDHIPLILKFAFLHNRHGNRDEAHLLFEQILTSYPKRTDIWSQYVDLLVKDGLVDNARQILERAVLQRLPMKNMKTLFTKYVAFEEKHGNRDSVRRVKQLATDYV